MVLQLQHLAQKTDSNIEELLRRAKLVAMKLNLKEFEEWCHFELSGYYSIDFEELPSYRQTNGKLYVFNPYNGLIPFYLEDDKAYRLVTTVSLRESVGECVNLITRTEKGSNLIINLPKPTLNFLLEAQYQSQGYALEPRLYIDVSRIMSILTHVRNIIFDWSLKLESSGILGEGMQFTAEEKVKAMTNTTYNIENMQGVAGHIQNSQIHQQNQISVTKMDISILLENLRKAGIEEQDLSDLKNALEEDPKPIVKDKFGTSVSQWYGKMISKAANGSWDIAVATAAGLLTQTLNNFYGLV
ncbi:hypothetical protein [Acinetobacter radioresistens]|uniref:AbiTii domain-containing protein n=1 Tax=Acinetobacter radioresistens TaxID=40216 RepID=UPI003213F994